MNLTKGSQKVGKMEVVNEISNRKGFSDVPMGETHLVLAEVMVCEQVVAHASACVRGGRVGGAPEAGRPHGCCQQRGRFT